MDGSERKMERRSLKAGADRYTKRNSRARPDRIIEKRPTWQDYLDSDEDSELIEDLEGLEPGEDEDGTEKKKVKDNGDEPGKGNDD
jgi:hypothetical protein